MKEIRTMMIKPKNAIKEDEELYVEGLAITYNNPTVINTENGAYTEVILPGALNETDFSDATLLYNHDLTGVPLARVPNTMKCEIVESGLMVKALLPDTEHGKSIHKSIKRGDLKGMSFSFTVPEDGEDYNPETNTRTISKIKKIYEISIVPFPAYEKTSIEARAFMNNHHHNITKDNLKIKINKILMKGGI